MRIRWNINTPSWIALHLLQDARQRVMLSDSSALAYSTLTRAIGYIIRTFDDASFVLVD